MTKAMCITTRFSVPWILQSIRSISPIGKEYEKDISYFFGTLFAALNRIIYDLSRNIHLF